MKNTIKISNQPIKGTSDWYPEEFAIRKYIFDTWRKVCNQYGYEEYLTPIVENEDIYKAKSGEDVGGNELMTMTDQGGRKLVIRPEMTPSVTRMITRKFTELNKPVRYFSIANFFRKEKPQRGRNREFWQLNYDIFGCDSLSADIEIIQIALEIMLSFGPPPDSFTFYINSRKLIDFILSDLLKITEEKWQQIVRLLDKWEKTKKEDIVKIFTEIGLSNNQIESLCLFMESNGEKELINNFPPLEESEGLKEIQQVITFFSELGYGKHIVFRPNIIRGFDYYNGLIFEVFDNSLENPRSLFGGGRYNGLSEIFGSDQIPATGCAPGDETTMLFLKSWGLIEKIRDKTKDKIYYLPLLSDRLKIDINKIAMELRSEGKKVVSGLDVQTVNRALEFANKKKYPFVLIYGEEEAKTGKCLIKDMGDGRQSELKLAFLTKNHL
jgi:histidyl-tRNA synthetase